MTSSAMGSDRQPRRPDQLRFGVADDSGEASRAGQDQTRENVLGVGNHVERQNFCAQTALASISTRLALA